MLHHSFLTSKHTYLRRINSLACVTQTEGLHELPGIKHLKSLVFIITSVDSKPSMALSLITFL